MSPVGRDAWVVEGSALCLAVFTSSRFIRSDVPEPFPTAIWALTCVYLIGILVLVAGVSLREGRAGVRVRREVLSLCPGRHELRDGFLTGLVGLAVLSLLEWVLRTFVGLHVGLHVGLREVADADGARLVAAIRARPWIALGLLSVAGVVEELVYRGWGILLVRRSRPMLAVPALVATSLLFGAAHVVLPLGSFVHFTLLGLVFGCVALAAGSVVPGALLHGLMNAAVIAAVAWG